MAPIQNKFDEGKLNENEHTEKLYEIGTFMSISGWNATDEKAWKFSFAINQAIICVQYPDISHFHDGAR